MGRRGAARTALAIVVTVAAGACGGSNGPSTSPGRPDDAGTKATEVAGAALQLADLPNGLGLHRCAYSGDMDEYLTKLRTINLDTYQSSSAVWERLKSGGAVAGYASYYGDSDRACDNLVKPPGQRYLGESDEEHFRHHPITAFSFVVQFPDPATAVRAYKSDYFGQSQLKRQVAFDVADGAPTGLGPNSVTSSSQGAPILNRQAIWQGGRFNVFFASTAIERRQSELATRAIDDRMKH